MNTLWQDIRYGFRTLLKAPGFTIVAVLALALGIGANTAIFSVVNTVLLRPLPYENSDRLVTIWGTPQGARDGRNNASLPDFTDFKTQAQSLEHIAIYSPTSATLGGGDDAELVPGILASAGLFPMLDASAATGRTFSSEEDRPDASPVVVLSHGLWQRRFGADRNIVGSQITLNSRSHTVLGVMPPEFRFPAQSSSVEYWMPIGSDPTIVARMNDRGSRFLRLIARTKPNTTLEQAEAELNTIARRLSDQYPDFNAGLGVRLVPLYDAVVGDVRPALLILLGAVGLVLLIACANIANLLLARAAARAKEIAVRTALGASRMRVVRQLLTESLLLAVLGGVLGLLLAVWGVDLLIAASPADIPRVKEVALDASVLAFTLLLSILTGAIFGIVPALQASKLDLNETLKEGSRGSTTGGRRNRARSALVVSEIALSLMLLIGAGLLIKSFLSLRATDPGFDPQRVVTTRLSLPRARYPETERQRIFFGQVLERTGTLPGVEAVGAVDFLPMAGSTRQTTFAVAGRPPRVPGQEPDAITHVIGAEYFRAMSIPLRQGRAFTERDGENAPPVIIVNETFVRRHFPNENPLGQRILIDAADPADIIPREIVGIVGDVRHQGLDVPIEPEFYLSYLQAPERRMTIVARTSAGVDTASIARAIRTEIRAVDTEQYVPAIATMDRFLALSIAPQRFNMLLLGVFAAVALLLASIGIFGVMNYTVTQRTHEIGIRLALGAQTGDVLKMVVGQGMMLAFIGVGLGLIGAFAVTRVMSSLLYGVSATDPLVFAGVAALLTIVAALACYIPARRAMKVDPMIALRYE